MPAVNLLQLRVELNNLLWNFTDPPEFRKTLLDLLEKFAYTAYRSESKARAVSTRPQLQVSLILLREMDLKMAEPPQKVMRITAERPQETNRKTAKMLATTGLRTIAS